MRTGAKIRYAPVKSWMPSQVRHKQTSSSVRGIRELNRFPFCGDIFVLAPRSVASYQLPALE
jgi:hypothetical protein